jgi:hypothetical protein
MNKATRLDFLKCLPIYLTFTIWAIVSEREKNRLRNDHGISTCCYCFGHKNTKYGSQLATY